MPDNGGGRMRRTGWPATHLRVNRLEDGAIEVWAGAQGEGIRVLVVRAGDGPAFAEKLTRATREVTE